MDHKSRVSCTGGALPEKIGCNPAQATSALAGPSAAIIFAEMFTFKLQR